MRLYKVKVRLDSHSWPDYEEKPEPFIKESYYILTEQQNIDTYITEYYGCWYYVEILDKSEIVGEDLHVSRAIFRTSSEEVRKKLTLAVTTLRDLANDILI